MTCIAGVVDADAQAVWIGGDSAGVGGWSLTQRADTKVFRVGPFLFGFTTSFRMGQLLQHRLTIPTLPYLKDAYARESVDRFMVCEFVDAVRDCLKAGGYARKQSEQESGGTFLVGYAGRLFRVDDDYQVGESIHGYDAVGCGGEVALGALYATEGQPARDRVHAALSAAERHSAGVRSPFVIESVEPTA